MFNFSQLVLDNLLTVTLLAIPAMIQLTSRSLKTVPTFEANIHEAIPAFLGFLIPFFLSKHCPQQRAKKVVSDSPGLVDLAIALVNSCL